MRESSEELRGSFWPGSGVLLLSAVLVAGGYAIALFRPSLPAVEVAVVVFAPPQEAPQLPPGGDS